MILPVLDNLHKIDIEPGQIGVTVRRGNKWRARVSKGQRINLQETIDGKSTIVGMGEVQSFWWGWFNEIPARLVEFEHEERSRLYSGLLDSMRHAYEGFDEYEEVTVFSYVRLAAEPLMVEVAEEKEEE